MSDLQRVPPDDDPLLAIAMAIADGEAIDWSTGSTPEAASSLTPGLRHLEDVVRGHALARVRGERLHRHVESTPDSHDTVLTESRRKLTVPSGPVHVEWGPLIVLDKIGRGSFGDVYRARDPHLDREVALKLVPETGPEADSPIVEEGRLLARVRHPNVLTVYGAERIAGRSGIWTEYVRGDTLAEEVRRRGRLNPEEAARVGVDICRALHAVHAAGLLHRDVKAQNIIRDETGRIVLADFGAGLRLDESQDVAERQIAGTPLYVAPEVIQHGQPSVAADLYSVGVLLYFLVTGDYPVRGRTLAEIRAAHREGRRVPLAQARADLPRGFVAIVERLIQVAPDRRFPTARAVERELGGWLHRRRRFAAAIVVAVVSSAAAWSIWTGATRWFARSLGAGSAGVPTARQVVDPPCFGAPSGIGTMVCVEMAARFFARGGEGSPPLLFFDPNTGDQQVLLTPPEGQTFESAVISADGTRAAFVASSPGLPSEIRVLNLRTRREELLARAAGDMRTVAVSAWDGLDDRIALRLWRGDNSQALALLSPRGGALETAFEFPASPQGVSRSPDGHYIAFDAPQGPDRHDRDIHVCDLGSGRCGVIAPHPDDDFFPFWAPDGRLMFDSDRAGPMGLWAVEMDGLRARAQPTLVRDTGRARLDPAGFTAAGELFYTLRTGEVDVYSAELTDDTAPPPTPVRLSPRLVDVNKSPVWSEDGRWLAYVSRRGPFADPGSMRIVLQSTVDGREQEFPYDIRMNMSRLAWSPDGRVLALRTLRDGLPPEGVFGIHLIDRTTGRIMATLSRRDPERAFDIDDVAWLDERTVVFSGPDGISVFDVPSGEERRVWEAPRDVRVSTLTVSPDRQWLAITFGGRAAVPWSALALLPSGGGAPVELLRVNRPDLLWAHTWTADGRAILVTRPNAPGSSDDVRQRLWRIPVDGSTPQRLSLALPGLNDVRVSGDGARVAFTAGGIQPEFWMVSGLSR